MEATPHTAAIVAWSGFALAFIFGAVGNKVNFCTMGAVSDLVNMGDWGRMRMWLLAIAVAIVGAYTLQSLGLIDLSKSIYTSPNFTWLSFIVGGFLFEKLRLEVMPDFWGNLITATIGAIIFLLIWRAIRRA